MRIGLAGLATARPEGEMAQPLAAELVAELCCRDERQVALLSAAFRRAGVLRRASVLLTDGAAEGPEGWRAFYAPPGAPRDGGPTTLARMERYAREAPPLARRAAAAALERAGLAPADVAHLVTVSCTGFFAPGLDAALSASLSLPPGVSRTHVGFMGCHGLVNGLRVGAALAATGTVLVCAVELCSLHVQYGFDPEQIVAASLFADGAAALLLTPGGSPEVCDSASVRLPGTEGAMSWSVGDHGFRMTLSRRVPEQIAAHLGPWMERWLSGQGLRIEEIGGWAIHPGGPRVLESVARCLRLPPAALEASRAVLAACGNMSAPTIAFILEELLARGTPRPWVAVAFGPGLVAESVLLR